MLFVDNQYINVIVHRKLKNKHDAFILHSCHNKNLNAFKNNLLIKVLRIKIKIGSICQYNHNISNHLKKQFFDKISLHSFTLFKRLIYPIEATIRLPTTIQNLLCLPHTLSVFDIEKYEVYNVSVMYLQLTKI